MSDDPAINITDATPDWIKRLCLIETGIQLAPEPLNRRFSGCLRRINPTPAKPSGFFASLTPEQQARALAYDGPDSHGDPAFLINPASPVQS